LADRPTLGAERILCIVEQVLRALPGRVIVIDRGEAETRWRLEHLARLRALCTAGGALLMVAARVDLALAAGADGVHLPERGLAPERVRAAWPELVVGRSCHDRQGLEAAQAGGAHYAFLSPVAAPHSKPLAGKALGIDGFTRQIQGLGLPIFALGGVTVALIPGLRAAGAAGLAALGGVLGASDPVAAARALVLCWDGLTASEAGA